jgi:hypothetical protein
MMHRKTMFGIEHECGQILLNFKNVKFMENAHAQAISTK